MFCSSCFSLFAALFGFCCASRFACLVSQAFLPPSMRDSLFSRFSISLTEVSSLVVTKLRIASVVLFCSSINILNVLSSAITVTYYLLLVLNYSFSGLWLLYHRMQQRLQQQKQNRLQPYHQEYLQPYLNQTRLLSQLQMGIVTYH